MFNSALYLTRFIYESNPQTKSLQRVKWAELDTSMINASVRCISVASNKLEKLINM